MNASETIRQLQESTKQGVSALQVQRDAFTSAINHRRAALKGNSDMLTLGSKVFSPEHPKAIGTVIRVSDNGDATIQFESPKSDSLPYGHIINEFWPVSDQSSLTLIQG